MSGKKMQRSVKSKGKKTVAKKTAKPNRLSLTAAMEKDFRDIPAKLASQYGKELAASKQQENKLNRVVKKAEAKERISKNKCDILAAKSTPVAKKRLVQAKKAFQIAHTAVSNLTAQLEQAKKLSNTIAQKQAKFAELSKQLLKLEKQLETESKKKPAKLKTKARNKPVEIVLETMTPSNFESSFDRSESQKISSTNDELVEENA